MNIIMVDIMKLLGYFLLMGKVNIVKFLLFVSGIIYVNYRYNFV